MPFTKEEFFAVFTAWNEAVWPLPLLAYLLGLLVLVLLFRPSRISTVAILASLAAMWLTNGIGYHWAFFARINPAAWLFGALFVLEGLLLLAACIAAREFRFRIARNARTVAGLALIGYAMVLYPLLGRAFGHVFPAVPVFGITPCPTTIFTIGVLLLGSWRTARWLLLVPGIWGIVGGSAAALLDVPQDYGLIAATLVVLVVATAPRWRPADRLHSSPPRRH